LVTGANRGLGAAFVRALADRGIRVYAGTRDPAAIKEQGVTTVRLDVTNPGEIATAAEHWSDVTLLVNNAGMVCNTTVLEPSSLDVARKEMDVNYFGPVAVTRAFAPVLAGNSGGAVINVLSIVSFFSFPAAASQAASKAAAWSMTNGLRMELREQGTLVVA
jgi:NAD(P)-dependent dehydrogenase (short-subunit alcohol dehydrogenase family)